MARIIADMRTLDKRVHVYSELYTQNSVYNVVKGISGGSCHVNMSVLLQLLFLHNDKGLIFCIGF